MPWTVETSAYSLSSGEHFFDIISSQDLLGNEMTWQGGGTSYRSLVYSMAVQSCVFLARGIYFSTNKHLYADRPIPTFVI